MLEEEKVGRAGEVRWNDEMSFDEREEGRLEKKGKERNCN